MMNRKGVKVIETKLSELKKKLNEATPGAEVVLISYVVGQILDLLFELSKAGELDEKVFRKLVKEYFPGVKGFSKTNRTSLDND